MDNKSFSAFPDVFVLMHVKIWGGGLQAFAMYVTLKSPNTVQTIEPVNIHQQELQGFKACVYSYSIKIMAWMLTLVSILAPPYFVCFQRSQSQNLRVLVSLSLKSPQRAIVKIYRYLKRLVGCVAAGQGPDKLCFPKWPYSSKRKFQDQSNCTCSFSIKAKFEVGHWTLSVSAYLPLINILVIQDPSFNPPS